MGKDLKMYRNLTIFLTFFRDDRTNPETVEIYKNVCR